MKHRKLPGTISYTGSNKQATTITQTRLESTQTSKNSTHIDVDEKQKSWINVVGFLDTTKIKNLCEALSVSPLVIEDILNIKERIKLEQHSNHLFLVIKYAYLEASHIKHDYFSVLLFDHLIITFFEHKTPITDDLEARLKLKNSQIQSNDINYFLYVLLDMVTDDCLSTLDIIEQRLERIEFNLLELKKVDQVTLYDTRKQLVYLRNIGTQLTQIIPTLLKTTFSADSLVYNYMQDVVDHNQLLTNKSTTLNDNISHILDVYLNTMSHKMNEIMTTLTIFSAIFIPLSFLAGVFGMNFTNFPILTNPNALLYFVIVCFSLPVIMIFYFKHKRWF
ncbi:MAG: hypothetical protein K9L74_06015 [Candidatus Izimaplasma sp.]|nr:hypothetical protein [Candidatus Izimaplasma bacterium]